MQSIHDSKSSHWATRWVPAALVLVADQLFVHRLIGVSTSPQVGSIYNVGVWDKAAATWLWVHVRRTLDNEAGAHRQYQVAGRSLNNAGCIAEPHILVDRCWLAKPPPRPTIRRVSSSSRTRMPIPIAPPIPLCPPPARTPPLKRTVLHPKDKGRPRSERARGGEEGGGGGRGGGGGGTNDPLVGTTAHVPYGGAVDVGTVTRKSRVVWVSYPDNPKVYEVEHHLIFGTAEAAEAHLQKVRKGKTPTTTTLPTKPANI